MSYDLFISYSRRDNQQGRITQLAERIQADFAAFAGRTLVPFFDVTEIHGMEDWRHRILEGLRESRLLLACLSPSYLDSEYCEWEFNEYVNHEIGRAYFGDGVAPIYFVEVPGWEDRGFERQCATWVAELRRRQYFDLRPWFHAGEECLRDAIVRERMRELSAQLSSRITRSERAEHSLGNVEAHNPHFIGRTTELRHLRQTLALGKVGVLTVVHGLGGVGKTALSIEYAHAFGHEYGGGCWKVHCEGMEDLRAAIAELAAPLNIDFDEDERNDTNPQFQRVVAELRRLANTHEPHRCLLLLDNVDKPRLLEPAQTQRLPAAEWLHVLATTRLGESDLFGKHKDRAFVPVDELPEADALELIQTYQPGATFPNDAEREAAQGIVNLLGRFTLAVETAAVYLGQFADDVTCTAFLARLKTEGLSGLDTAAEQTSEGVRHGEKRLAATLAPTLERLSGPEKLALSYAAVLPADHIFLPWIRVLVAEQFPDFGRDAAPGYPDSWKSLLRRLLSLRLLQLTGVISADGQPLEVRVHRLVQELSEVLDSQDHVLEREQALFALIAVEAQNTRMVRDYLGDLSWLEAASLAPVGEVAVECEKVVRRSLLHRNATLALGYIILPSRANADPHRTPLELYRDWLQARVDRPRQRSALLSRFAHMEYDLTDSEERREFSEELGQLRSAADSASSALAAFRDAERDLGSLEALREILSQMIGQTKCQETLGMAYSCLAFVEAQLGNSKAAAAARADARNAWESRFRAIGTRSGAQD